MLYLLTFVSIPTLVLYHSVRGANYILGAGPDTRVYVGVILELIVALAGIGTAVALYPVVKRQNEGVALGFVGVRTLEAAMIFVGAFSLLTVVAFRKAGAGAGALPASHVLVSLHDWTFILGQGLIPAVNGLLLGYLLYKSRLVPRVSPCWPSSEHPCSSSPPPSRLSAPRTMGPGFRGCSTPDRAVGVLAGRLPGRQGVQGGWSAAARF